jgi:aldose 1-epimerase
MAGSADPVELVAGPARVALAPATGGAIAAYTFGGTAVLRPTPEDARDVRRHACYPLVPYSNRIADARLLAAGATHALARNFGDHPHAIHGVGWQRPWRVAAADATTALLALDHDPAGPGATAWPWRFRARQWFALAADAGGAALVARLAIENTGDAAFPFGLGWHPFLTLAPDTELGFAAGAVWRNDPTQLPRERVPLPAEWRFDPPRPLGDARLDNVFAQWAGRAVLRHPGRALEVTVEADRACAFLVVYVPPGGDCIALEPVTHMTDAFNRAARGERDTGTRHLEPGAAFSCTMRLSVRTLPT